MSHHAEMTTMNDDSLRIDLSRTVLRRLARAGGAAFLVWLACAPARAQGGTPDLSAMDGPQRELVELFGKVEVRLREIDRLLFDAGAGDVSALEKVGPSGIDELLKQSKAQGEAAIQDIDKILEIARNMQQQSSSSGSGQGQQQQQQQQSGGDGQSPLDGQSQGGSQRENTPSGPEQQGQDPSRPKGGNQQQGQEGDPKSPKDGQKPGSDGRPNNPTASKDDAQNQASGPPPGSGQGAPSSTSEAKDRWGDLPVHARDVFRNEGGRDMPVQYREWIDAYYKRLNKKSP